MMSSPFRLYLPDKLLNQSHGTLYGYLDDDQAYVTKLRQCSSCPMASTEETYLGTWTDHTARENGLADCPAGVVTLLGPIGEYPKVIFHLESQRPVIVMIFNATKVMAANYDGKSKFVLPLAITLRKIVKEIEGDESPCHDAVIENRRDHGLLDHFSSGTVETVNCVGHCAELVLSKPGSKFQRILSFSYTLTHLSLIYRQASKIFVSSTGESRKNFASRLLVNFVIGLLVLFFINNYSFNDVIASAAIRQAKFAAEQISQLLAWILGVPAGLKLNKQLTNLLGSFFSYHIYLWQGYLFFLQPYLSSIIFLGSLTGILGFTLQISFTLDLIAMMSLHIHCFYVYAARLYSFQLYALLSLWNLFRGKKSNVLRSRVDSLAYDARQLFIGTLLFTCLFFLFPTTLVYYACFTILRLSVVSIQGVLYRLSLLLNRIPVYKLLLVLTGSEEICVNLSFRTIHCASDGQTLFLSMDLTPLSISELKLDEFEVSEENVSWSDFGKKLLVGDLVYPWIRIGK